MTHPAPETANARQPKLIRADAKRMIIGGLLTFSGWVLASIVLIQLGGWLLRLTGALS